MSEVKIAPIPDLGQRTDEITIYAGPCSVESAEQFDRGGRVHRRPGLTWIRGGASSRAPTRTRSKASARKRSRS